jgi:hypothetical protein
MQRFLSPLVHQLRRLELGVQCAINEVVQTLRVVVLTIVMDLRAKVIQTKRDINNNNHENRRHCKIL